MTEIRLLSYVDDHLISELAPWGVRVVWEVEDDCEAVQPNTTEAWDLLSDMRAVVAASHRPLRLETSLFRGVDGEVFCAGRCRDRDAKLRFRPWQMALVGSPEPGTAEEDAADPVFSLTARLDALLTFSLPGDPVVLSADEDGVRLVFRGKPGFPLAGGRFEALRVWGDARSLFCELGRSRESFGPVRG